MKKLLKKLKGVESSSLDVKNGLVTVSGHIGDPDNSIDITRRKVKPVTFFSTQNDYEHVSESEPNTIGSTSSHRPKNSSEESGECSRKGGMDVRLMAVNVSSIDMKVSVFAKVRELAMNN